MANEVVYIGARVPILDPNDPKMISTEWFRYLNKIGVKASVIDGNIALSATAGSAGTLPGPPAGYMIINLNGGKFKVPYYNT